MFTAPMNGTVNSSSETYEPLQKFKTCQLFSQSVCTAKAESLLLLRRIFQDGQDTVALQCARQDMHASEGHSKSDKGKGTGMP